MDPDSVSEKARGKVTPTVLVAEVEPRLCEAFRQALGPDHRVVEFGSSGALEAWVSRAAAGAADAVILGDQLRDPGILEVVASLRESEAAGDAALIVSHQAAASPQLDALAAQGVVFYFLRQPFRHSVLRQVVSRGVQATMLRRENARLREQLDRIHGRLARENRFLRTRAAWTGELKGLLGQSPALKQVLSELERVRVTDATVHLHGETGTGKELMARALHQSGPRAGGPFLAVNCAGMPESLLQSTLFGHRRGSFTGADRDHSGLFTEADGGTLFLDEVAELPPSLQAALLRAVQEREVTPVGATRPVKVDVRLISATHADLRAEVAAGRFREDLYFRLMVVAVRLPPLRERLSDVPLLANHFVTLHRQRLGRRGGDLTEAALRVLTTYPWPGNVRELEHEMERLVVLSDEETPLGPELLSPQVSRPAGGPAREEGVFIPEGLSYDHAVELLMRRLIDDALAATGGGIASAAARLGMERSRLGKLRRRLQPGAPE